MGALERCVPFSDNHTTYEALIFDLIQHSSTFRPITMLIYTDPQFSFVSTCREARRYPLALEYERFYGNKRWRKLERSSLTGTKGIHVAGLGRNFCMTLGAVMTTTHVERISFSSTTYIQYVLMDHVWMALGAVVIV